MNNGWGSEQCLWQALHWNISTINLSDSIAPVFKKFTTFDSDGLLWLVTADMAASQKLCTKTCLRSGNESSPRTREEKRDTCGPTRDTKRDTCGPLRCHGFDKGMTFANPPHARCLAWVISSRKIWFSESRVNPYMGVDTCKGKPCLISSFELSVHQFGTILKSFALTFQSASI